MYYDYGDLDETGGNYKIQLADGIEVGVEEHEQLCGCGCEEGFSDSGLSSEDDYELSELELSEPEMWDEISSRVLTSQYGTDDGEWTIVWCFDTGEEAIA